MANIINALNCVKGNNNVSWDGCVIDPKNIVGAIITPPKTKITAANALILQTYLQGLAKNDNKTLRIYPIHYFDTVTDNTEDKTVNTFGYGGKSVGREGTYDWTFNFRKGALFLSNQLRGFNGDYYEVLFYDRDGLIIGTQIGDDLYSIPLNFMHANYFRASDGTNPSIYSIQFVFNGKYINEQGSFLNSGIDLTQIVGLKQINLKFQSRLTNVLKIKLFLQNNNTDLYDLYSTALAVPTAWKFTNSAGADLTITSVAVDPAIKGWTITLDNADPDYGTGANIYGKLSAPSVLEGLSVVGFESDIILIP